MKQSLAHRSPLPSGAVVQLSGLPAYDSPFLPSSPPLNLVAQLARFENAIAGDLSMEKKTNAGDNPFEGVGGREINNYSSELDLGPLLQCTNELGVPDHYLAWINDGDSRPEAHTSPSSDLNDQSHAQLRPNPKCAPTDPCVAPDSTQDLLLETDVGEDFHDNDLSNEFTGFDDSVFGEPEDPLGKAIRLRDQFVRNMKANEQVSLKDAKLATDLLSSLDSPLTPSKMKIIEIRSRLITHPEIRGKLVQLFYAASPTTL